MRAVWRLVALGRAGLPDAASAVTSSFAGFAFFPWGLPCAFPSPLCCCAFGFFSSAIPCFYLSHGFGLLLLPVREEMNFAIGIWQLANAFDFCRCPKLRYSTRSSANGWALAKC